VNPRAGQDGVEKRKFLTLPGLELRPCGEGGSRIIIINNININNCTITPCISGHTSASSHPCESPKPLPIPLYQNSGLFLVSQIHIIFPVLVLSSLLNHSDNIRPRT
jgi:hypothetical protein